MYMKFNNIPNSVRLHLTFRYYLHPNALNTNKLSLCLHFTDLFVNIFCIISSIVI